MEQAQNLIPEQSITVNELKSKLPSIEELYKFVVEKMGRYLPKWSGGSKRPKWLTTEYLTQIMEYKVFSIETKKIKKPPKMPKNLT